MEPWRVQSN